MLLMRGGRGTGHGQHLIACNNKASTRPTFERTSFRQSRVIFIFTTFLPLRVASSGGYSHEYSIIIFDLKSRIDLKWFPTRAKYF